MKWIPIERPFQIELELKLILSRLSQAGFTTYVVGGSVRDFLLGRTFKDHDIVTDAKPDEVELLFPHSIAVGKKFGVIKIPLASGEVIEVATFRKDGKYSDHRHPETVEFSNASDDAKRRDFTINALFFDPKTQRILDEVGGITDLKLKVIRAIGVPEKRFEEDALRLLRAIRFATVLSFKIEDSTFAAIQKKARLIKKVSIERITDEMTRILVHPKAVNALVLLERSEIFPHLFPEIQLSRAKKFFMNECERKPEIAWALLLSETDSRKGKDEVGKTVKRLRVSSDLEARVLFCLSENYRFKEIFQMREATLMRFLSEPYIKELLEFHRLSVSATDGNLAFYEFAFSRLKEIETQGKSLFSKLVDGRDLIELGLRPGPDFQRILKQVEDMAIEKKLTTKEEALSFILEKYVR